MGSPVDIGKVLAGKYRVERTIGEGGMGVVVEATDTRLERRVAIKFLLPEYAEHAEAASRFMREARAAVKIKSDHTARVIDVGTLESGSPYMVMEYLEGADLSKVLERDGVLSVEDAALYLIQACEAVAEAHSHGIVHRDLKPANLFLAAQPDGSVRIKVLDFGISKVADTHKDQSLTRTSSMMGSPLYMSPEQMRSTRNVDSRTDIWALGVIFYELVTGSLPFVANSVPELSAKVLLEEHEPLSARRPDLPVALERVVARALCKSPVERYPSIAEFAMDLLPYAPHRARHNVERITRVLHAAGLSKSRFNASERPAPYRAEGRSEPGLSVDTLMQNRSSGLGLPGSGSAEAGGQSALGPQSLVETGSVPDATQVNFGQTSAPRRKGRVGMLAALIVGTVALVGGAAFLVTHAGSHTLEPEAVRKPSAEVEPAMKAASPPRADAEPALAEPEVSEAPAASDSADQGEAPKPESSAAEASQNEASKAAKRVGRAVSRPVKRATSPKPQKHEAAKPAANTELFGEFGGRK